MCVLVLNLGGFFGVSLLGSQLVDFYAVYDFADCAVMLGGRTLTGVGLLGTLGL